MSASPFRTTTGPFIEVPVPVAPSSLSEAKRDLEDVPFEADIHEFPAREQSQFSTAPKANRHGWLSRLFAGRAERRLREEMLKAELQDLRASYAGLLHSTEDIREQFEAEKEERKGVAKALSPFPAAVAGIENLQTRQEEAGEILSTIRERLDSTVNRDESLLSAMDSVHGGVGKLQTEVGAVNVGVEKVTEVVSGIAEGQIEVGASIENFDKKMELRFEEAATSAQVNVERMEQSGDEVLQVLRQMERNSQRGLWIFASLLAILFVALICFSANVNRLTSSAVVEPVSAPVTAPAVVEESLIPSEPVAQVLEDDFEF
ncbi:MAG: hypothetical protein ACSHYB_01035 [Roseibacillus sp.]